MQRSGIRFLAACLLGVAAALLISCGSSGAGLIPAASAGPLQGDFEEVVQAARSGNGSCAATEAALTKTEADFQALPSTVATALRNRLQQGIANLHTRALALCRQPLAGTSATSTSPSTTTTSTRTTTTTPTVTQPTTTQTTPTSTATTPSTTPGGTTSSPKTGGAEASPGNGGGGATPGEAGAGAGAGGPGGSAGGPEVGK